MLASSPQYRTPTVLTTATEKDARRVLEWQEDVARSISCSSPELPPARPASPPPAPALSESSPPRVVYRRSETFPMSNTQTVDRERERSGREPMRLVRRETVTTEHYHPRDRDAERGGVGGGGFATLDREPERRDSGYAGDNIWGVSNKVVGTLLGAAAGAAFAYAMVQGSDSSPRKQETTPSGIRYTTRRNSEAGSGMRERTTSKVYYQEPEEEEEDPLAYGGYGDLYAERRGRTPPSRFGAGRVETIPSSSGVGSESGRKKYITYTTAPPQPPSMRTRDLEPITERSHFSERSEGRRSRRSRSEVSGCRYPAAIPLPASTVFQEDRKSHISTRSRRSGGSDATVKPSRVEYESSNAGRGGGNSKVYSKTTIRVVPKSSASAREEVDDYRERRSQASVRLPSQVKAPTTVVSPRGVPPPRSVVGGGREYAVSVAPSDSVSSVGSKRERERLRMRMER